MNWVSPQDIANGIDGMPKIPIKTQNTLRSKKLITYTKIGRNVVYKKEWIEEYLNSNMRQAK